MDDFFLRPEQRIPERYAQPGGNVDYERFQEEVLEHLPAEEQKARILARNGEEKYERFVNEWIPIENRYFETYGIRDKCIRVSLYRNQSER